MKKVFIMLLVFWGIYLSNSYATEIFVNDEMVNFDVKPFIENGRTLVPVKGIFEKLNADVKWNQEMQLVTIDDRIRITIGSTRAFVGDVEYILDVPAKIVDSRTFVPVRFISEALNYEVKWINENVYISKYGNNPISPIDYQKLLKKGIDVDWSKTSKGKAGYSKIATQNFFNNGISHVRIRVKDEISDELLTGLDSQINDCIEVGLIPVLAYQADELKNNPTDKNIEKVVDWWTTISKRYKDTSYLLSFDLLIEVTDSLNDKPEKLNEIYERLVREIRETNPQRIIMISPRLRSDASYLADLKIPTKHNNYLMAEWHFYASGPSKTNERKLWTTGTEEEKALIDAKINLAKVWQEENKIPTWVGAWMPGNYNDGNDYTVEEQIIFASYMREKLDEAGIPFAINSDNKFYDYENNEWIESMRPIFDCIYKY